MQQRRVPWRVPFVVVFAMGFVLLGAAVAITLLTSPASATAAVDPVNLGVVPGTAASRSGDAHSTRGSGSQTPAQPTQPTQSIQAAPPIQPERIRIPRLGVDAPVLAAGIRPTGSLDVPDDPHLLGWWAGGAVPGATRGTAVVAGHVNATATGPGAFTNLSQLRPGDEVTVVGADREARFTVVAVRQYPKTDLPAEEAFSQEVTGRLALVTCTGPFGPRSGSYPDNLIVYAVAADR